MNNSHFAQFDSPLGPMLARARNNVLTGVWFSGQITAPVPAPASMIDATQHRIFAVLSEQLGEYFSGDRVRFDIPHELVGTAWQCRVWRRLHEVDYGHTVTYGQLAALVGHPQASRAVGTAVGKNPLSIIVPCHRVLPASGGVGNYAAGAERKRWLLRLEGGDVSVRRTC